MYVCMYSCSYQRGCDLYHHHVSIHAEHCDTKLQALVYHVLLPTSAIADYAIDL